MTTNPLEWKAYDRLPRTHTPDWYWAVGIIALSIVIAAIILDNILFAVLIFISTIVLFLRTLQKPRQTEYALTAKGVWVGKEFTPYQTLESFWVEEAYGDRKLLIKAKSIASPLMSIPLGEESPDAVGEYLAGYLPEEEHHEPLSKKIMEFLGF